MKHFMYVLFGIAALPSFAQPIVWENLDQQNCELMNSGEWPSYFSCVEVPGGILGLIDNQRDIALPVIYFPDFDPLQPQRSEYEYLGIAYDSVRIDEYEGLDASKAGPAFLDNILYASLDYGFGIATTSRYNFSTQNEQSASDIWIHNTRLTLFDETGPMTEVQFFGDFDRTQDPIEIILHHWPQISHHLNSGFSCYSQEQLRETAKTFEAIPDSLMGAEPLDSDFQSTANLLALKTNRNQAWVYGAAGHQLGFGHLIRLKHENADDLIILRSRNSYDLSRLNPKLPPFSYRQDSAFSVEIPDLPGSPWHLCGDPGPLGKVLIYGAEWLEN